MIHPSKSSAIGTDLVERIRAGEVRALQDLFRQQYEPLCRFDLIDVVGDGEVHLFGHYLLLEVGQQQAEDRPTADVVVASDGRMTLPGWR